MSPVRSARLTRRAPQLPRESTRLLFVRSNPPPAESRACACARAWAPTTQLTGAIRRRPHSSAASPTPDASIVRRPPATEQNPPPADQFCRQNLWSLILRRSVACTGICLVLYLSGLSTSTAADSLSSLSILRAHPDGRRRSGRRGDLLSQQPHNAAPLQPVFCFSRCPVGWVS